MEVNLITAIVAYMCSRSVSSVLCQSNAPVAGRFNQSRLVHKELKLKSIHHCELL
jgi:hypothetical protein